MLTTVLVLSLFAAGPAKAPKAAAKPAAKVAPKAEPAAAGDPTTRAKELFQWAQKLYKQARYVEAIAKFEEAYALKPHPVIYFNIGRCYEQIPDTAKALRAYRDYLRLSPDAPDRESVTDAIANLERRLKESGVQQLLVFAEPPAAKIEVDGKDLGSSPASVELKAGNHKLAVRAEGFEPVERSFVMSTAHATEMTITLRPVAATPEPARVVVVRETPPPPPPAPPVDTPRAVALTPPPAPPPVEIKQAPEPAPRKGRLFTWVALGTAAAAGGAGVGLGLASKGAESTLKGSVHDRDTANALAGQATGMATGANVAFGVAGAALITGAVLFFVEGR